MSVLDKREALIWIYPWDLQDEGISEVLDRLQDNGITGVNVAGLYHSGRFFLPHNPNRKVYFPESGALYFEPDPQWYGKLKIKPPISQFASNSFWNELREETLKRNMSLTCWMLGLHNSKIGFEHPEVSVVNAFGERVSVALCPSHPDVQDLMLAVVEDLTNNFQFDRILIESLEYMPFRHDYHHEVIGIPLTPAIEFLMSLSFNEYLVRDARNQGIDINQVKLFVRETCEKQFENPHQPLHLTWEDLYEALNGEFKKYLLLREKYLTKIIRKIQHIVKKNGRTKLAALDFGPILSMGLYQTSWENGVNLEQWSNYIDELHPTFYFTDERVFRRKVQEYKGLIGQLKQDVKVIPALRSILPQVESKEDLEKSIHLLRESKLNDGYSFYNYGFMSFKALKWIGELI